MKIKRTKTAGFIDTTDLSCRISSEKNLKLKSMIKWKKKKIKIIVINNLCDMINDN